jgi:CBS domain-containing protein
MRKKDIIIKRGVQKTEKKPAMARTRTRKRESKEDISARIEGEKEDRENKIGVLPVIDTNDQCIGVIRLHDIAGHIR